MGLFKLLELGGVVGLRDPGVGRPTGLTAKPGANAIQLDWDGNWQSRIRGAGQAGFKPRAATQLARHDGGSRGVGLLPGERRELFPPARQLGTQDGGEFALGDARPEWQRAVGGDPAAGPTGERRDVCGRRPQWRRIRAQLTCFCGESPAGGAGGLALLKFRANPGAETRLFSELAIADLVLSDSTGVIDLRQKNTLVTTNGQVAVTIQQNIDNARNGLPAWWEMQQGLDLFTANAGLDPENDGRPNLLEYASGGNPTLADALERGVSAGRAEADGKTFLSLGF
jgi:hypothetical protein